MPKLLNLTSKQRDKIFRAYARKCSPREISRMYPELKLSPQQVQNMVLREGWAKRKTEITEAKKQSVQQVLAEVREEAADEFRTFLELSGESLEEDGERLKAGWSLVANAADASSLMRAKKLHFERGIEHYLGGSTALPPNVAQNISAFYVQAAPVQRLSVREKAEQLGEAQDREDSEDHSVPRLAKS